VIVRGTVLADLGTGGYQMRIFLDLARKQPQPYLTDGEDFFPGEEFLSLRVHKVFAIMENHGIRVT
jgi:hypothetical protein